MIKPVAGYIENTPGWRTARLAFEKTFPASVSGLSGERDPGVVALVPPSCAKENDVGMGLNQVFEQLDGSLLVPKINAFLLMSSCSLCICYTT